MRPSTAEGWYVLPIIVVSFCKCRGKKPAALHRVNALSLVSLLPRARASSAASHSGVHGAANSVRSLSPLGERVGVRGLPAVLVDANPLTHSFLLQKRAAISRVGRGHE